MHSDSKAGRDAGELCGGPPLGVTATQDADALLDLGADVVCYTASSDIRPDGVIDDLCRILASGANVVSTSFVPLLHPAHAGPGVLERLEAACQEGGTSFYTSGIDPGFGNAGITIHALALCKEVRTVRMMEIVNYATWDNPFTMFEIMGFGKADPSESLLLSPGSTALAWGPVLHLVADALGLTIDDVVERHEVLTADTDIEIASGTVAAGTISGMRFEICKSALARGSGQITLIYANRDEKSVIFAGALRDLAADYPDRFSVVHWLESVQGLPSAAALARLAAPHTARQVFICGPGPFMAAASKALETLRVPAEQVHIEVFKSLESDPFKAVTIDDSLDADDDRGPATAVVTLDGSTREINWPRSAKLLDVLLAKGLDAPFSCREGHCGACAVVLKSGSVDMEINDVLEQSDLDEGLILACQAHPTSDSVEVNYDE